MGFFSNILCRLHVLFLSTPKLLYASLLAAVFVVPTPFAPLSQGVVVGPQEGCKETNAHAFTMLTTFYT